MQLVDLMDATQVNTGIRIASVLPRKSRYRAAIMLEQIEAAPFTQWRLETRLTPRDFPQILQRYRVSVVHFLYRMVLERTIAEQLALETFSTLPGSNESDGGIATRLFQTAFNLAVTHLRNQNVSAESNELTDVFEGARNTVIAMPIQQKAALLLHKFHQLEYLQIADVLDCPESDVKSWVLSGYDILRRQLPYTDLRS